MGWLRCARAVRGVERTGPPKKASKASKRGRCGEDNVGARHSRAAVCPRARMCALCPVPAARFAYAIRTPHACYIL